jgi:hypothetical protein
MTAFFIVTAVKTSYLTKLKYFEKTCHFVHHKSHMNRPRFKPEPPQWEASN